MSGLALADLQILRRHLLPSLEQPHRRSCHAQMGDLITVGITGWMEFEADGGRGLVIARLSDKISGNGRFSIVVNTGNVGGRGHAQLEGTLNRAIFSACQANFVEGSPTTYPISGVLRCCQASVIAGLRDLPKASDARSAEPGVCVVQLVDRPSVEVSIGGPLKRHYVLRCTSADGTRSGA